MKKIALIFGLTLVLAACHTKKPQNESGINDPVNVSYGDVDKSVMDEKTAKSAEAEAPAHEETVAADTTASTSCIDSTKINKDAACTMDYKPVCGCDNQTYSNACSAEKAGVTKFTEGECPGHSKEKKSEEAPAKKKKKH